MPLDIYWCKVTRVTRQELISAVVSSTEIIFPYVTQWSSSFRKADNSSVINKFPFLWKNNFHYHVYKCPTLVRIHSWIQSTFSHFFIKINFNSILGYMLSSFKCSFFVGVSHQKCTFVYFLSHACHMFNLAHVVILMNLRQQYILLSRRLMKLMDTIIA